jgi:glycosyltransferase involved in cell wall biosynthesis
MLIVLDARTATDHFPGIGRYVVNLARGLRSIAPELDLALLRDPRASSERLTLPTLPTIDIPLSPFSIQQQWRVPQLLRGRRAALYHSPFYLMPYRPGVPTVLTAYDAIPLAYPQYLTMPQRLIFRFTHDLAVRTARIVLAISEATRRDLIKRFGVPERKIVVTPLAADPCFQPQTTERLAAIRSAYHLPDRFVLYFGSNKPHKNLVRLIEAWMKTERGAQDTELVIGGAWDARYNEAKQVAAHNARIHFIGPVREDDLPALYGGATAFAFVSEYEGFGLPALEAMACGTPVIASNVSSLPEVVGDAGLLVDPHDTSAIATALGQLLSDPALRLDLAQRGLTRAAQFSWEHTARLTLEVYQALSTTG